MEDNPQQRPERTKSLAELGRDVLLTDEEGTVFFQCKYDALSEETNRDETRRRMTVDGKLKPISLAISSTLLKLEVYKTTSGPSNSSGGTPGMHVEEHPFTQLRKWEVKKASEQLQNQSRRGASELAVEGMPNTDCLLLDFGKYRDPSQITLFTSEAEKASALLYERIGEMIRAKEDGKEDELDDNKTEKEDAFARFKAAGNKQATSQQQVSLTKAVRACKQANQLQFDCCPAWT